MVKITFWIGWVLGLMAFVAWVAGDDWEFLAFLSLFNLAFYAGVKE